MIISDGLGITGYIKTSPIAAIEPFLNIHEATLQTKQGQGNERG